MSTLDKEFLWELIDSADMAIRTACELRCFLVGENVADVDILERAQVFLRRARDGGSFVSGSHGRVEGTLRPLNWATDVYLCPTDPNDVRSQTSLSPDYEQIANRLAQMDAILEKIRKGLHPNDEDVSKTISFFERLGGLLGSQADKGMLREFRTLPV